MQEYCEEYELAGNSYENGNTRRVQRHVNDVHSLSQQLSANVTTSKRKKSSMTHYTGRVYVLNKSYTNLVTRTMYCWNEKDTEIGMEVWTHCVIYYYK